MKLSDYLLIAGILLVLIGAVRVCIRNRARGKTCSGDCSSCGRGCGK